MCATQGEFCECLRVLAGAFTFKKRSTVASSALAAVSCWLSSIVKGTIGPAPDSTFPVLGYVKCVVGSRRKFEAVKMRTKSIILMG